MLDLTHLSSVVSVPVVNGITYAFVVRAQVDQGWGKAPDNASPYVPPQSHVVNARTNTSWYADTDMVLSVKANLTFVCLPGTPFWFTGIASTTVM